MILEVVCTFILCVGVYRLARFGLDPDFLPVTVALFGFGLTKASQLDVAVYRVDPWIGDHLGVYNTMDLLSVLSFTVTSVGLSAYTTRLLTDRDFSRTFTAAGVGSVALLVFEFAMSPMPSADSDYVTKSFPPYGWSLAFWITFIAVVTTSMTLVLVASFVAFKQSEIGILRTVSALYCLGATAGIVWVLLKAANILAFRIGYSGPIVTRFSVISTVTVTVLTLSFAIAALIFAGSAFSARVRRYRSIRRLLNNRGGDSPNALDVVLDPDLLPTPSRWSAWRASQGGVAVHRMKVEAADALQRRSGATLA